MYEVVGGVSCTSASFLAVLLFEILLAIHVERTVSEADVLSSCKGMASTPLGAALYEYTHLSLVQPCDCNESFT